MNGNAALEPIQINRRETANESTMAKSGENDSFDPCPFSIGNPYAETES
jgi:hypothetical protein